MSLQKITVLMPTYNYSMYISDAINSILNQTYKNFEFLIVDDGSTDDTEKVVKEFDDSRIRYIKRKHTGVSAARNYGLKMANFDWVALMDADDIAHPERFEKQIRLIQNEKDVIFTSYTYFNGSRILFNVEPDFNKNNIRKNFLLHSYVQNSSVLYNKKFIIDNNGYNPDLTIAEDYELWLRLIDKANFIHLNEILMYVRYNKKSMFRSRRTITEKTIYSIQKPYYDDFGNFFNINDKSKINNYRGWREYFFNSPKSARKYWLQSPDLFLNYRVFAAFLLTLLPNSWLEKIKNNSLRPRVAHIISAKPILHGKIKNDFKLLLNKLRQI